MRGRSAARITLERAKASRAPPLACPGTLSAGTLFARSPFSLQIHDEKGDRVVLRHDRAKFLKRQRIVFNFGQFRRGPPFAHYKYDNSLFSTQSRRRTVNGNSNLCKVCRFN